MVSEAFGSGGGRNAGLSAAQAAFETEAQRAHGGARLGVHGGGAAVFQFATAHTFNFDHMAGEAKVFQRQAGHVTPVAETALLNAAGPAKFPENPCNAGAIRPPF